MICGKGECSEMVCVPLPMANEIVFKESFELFCVRMAFRRLPGPSSAALVTVKEASKRRGSTGSRRRTRFIRRTRDRHRMPAGWRCLMMRL